MIRSTLLVQVIFQVGFADSLSVLAFNGLYLSIHFFDLVVVELKALLVALLLLLQILLQLSYLRFHIIHNFFVFEIQLFDFFWVLLIKLIKIEC